MPIYAFHFNFVVPFSIKFLYAPKKVHALAAHDGLILATGIGSQRVVSGSGYQSLV